MRIAICDDEIYTAQSLCSKVDKILKDWKLEYEIVCFKTGFDMLSDIEIRGIYDIVFLDIELGTANGINIAKKLREEYPIFELIFISQYQEYYREVFEVDARWFLDKPFSDERLERALKKAVCNINKTEDIFEFTFKKSIYRIALREVVYIESYKRKLLIHCRDKRIYEYYERLDKLEDFIYKGNIKFLRISQSYLVNAMYIKIYSYEEIELYNGECLKISQGRRELIRDMFVDREF